MNALDRGITRVFDVLLWPLDQLGRGPALVIASGIFGVLALVCFKHLSRQKSIKVAKDKIKAHLIEIRIYQDDLRVVSRAIGKVLVRNVQYLAFNLMPLVPLALPFAFVLAQFVVRYGFAPIPVKEGGHGFLAGQGTTIEITLAPAEAARVRDLEVHSPVGVKVMSPLVRIASEGRAFQEIVATLPGRYEIQFALPAGASSGSVATKTLYAGNVTPRTMQPARGRGFESALLWPAEPTFQSDSPFERIAFVYPDSDLGWMPGGPGGVLIVFLVSSLLFGALAIKPLRIQI
jgi:hypothetical protein